MDSSTYQLMLGVQIPIMDLFRFARLMKENNWEYYQLFGMDPTLKTKYTEEIVKERKLHG